MSTQLTDAHMDPQDWMKNNRKMYNKANLRDLIAAAGLVTLFGQRDFETAWMIVKNNHLQMKIISYQINPAEMKAIVPGIHYPFFLKWFDHQINDLP